METINDIVAEMRKRFEPYAKSDSNDARYVAYLGYAEFANRIEQAVKSLEADRDNWRKQALAEDERANATQSVTNCNQYMMREALETISKCDVSKEEDCYTLYRVCEEALSAPPRNCDVYATEAEAYRGWERYYNSIDPKDSYLDFEDWLFAEEKGDEK